MTTNMWTPAHLIGCCLAHTLQFAVGLLHLSPVLIAMGLNMPDNMSLGQHLLMHQWSCGIRVTFTVLPPPSPDNEGLLLHCCHCHDFGLLGAHWRNWGYLSPLTGTTWSFSASFGRIPCSPQLKEHCVSMPWHHFGQLHLVAYAITHEALNSLSFTARCCGQDCNLLRQYCLLFHKQFHCIRLAQYCWNLALPACP